MSLGKEAFVYLQFSDQIQTVIRTRDGRRTAPFLGTHSSPTRPPPTTGLNPTAGSAARLKAAKN